MNRIARFGLAVLITSGLGGVLTADSPKSRLVTGRVSAVTNDSLSVAQGSETLTFAVDRETKLEGKGLSTCASCDNLSCGSNALRSPVTSRVGVASCLSSSPR